MEAIEQVRFLAASEHRVEILRSLTTESLSPARIRDEHDAARATVHRILDSFEEFGWVRKTDGGYVTTSAGRIVLERFESVWEAADEVESMSGFLSQFERARDVPLPLDDYRVVTATRTDPHAATEYFAKSIPNEASQLRALVPTVVPTINRALRPLVERGASIRLVLSRSAAETSRKSYRSEFEEALSADSLSLFVSPEAFRFGLAAVDEDVFLGGYGEKGHLRACLHSTDDDLREWALSEFQSVRSDADPLEASVPKA